MSDKTPAGSARITKTTRVSHVVTGGDIASPTILLDAVWESPFKDLNYTSVQAVEVIAPANPDAFYANAFSRSVDKVSVSINCAGGDPGDVIVLHAHAIRD
jgi:hypothetical protein